MCPRSAAPYLPPAPNRISTVSSGNIKDFAKRLLQRVHGSLDHALSAVTAVAIAGGGLAAHGREGVVAGREADKEREGDQPDAEAKVGGDLGKGGHVGRVVVGRAVDGRLLGGLKVAEPEVVVDQDEDCGKSDAAPGSSYSSVATYRMKPKRADR